MSVGLSSFLLFLVLYAKGEENLRGQQLFRRGVNNFFDVMERRLLQLESCSYPLRVDFARLRV